MELEYRKANIEDTEFLAETRVEVLRAANHLSEDTDMSEIKRQSLLYYQRALGDCTHVAYLVFDEGRFVGAGGVSFFQVMPTCHNPSGYKGYIMNMYTHPSCRRRGIVSKTLDLLIQAAREKGITALSLEATDMGRPLYEKYGFVKMENEMELPQCDSPFVSC